ncbi:serine-threonine protein kinase 19-domain-containing protein [Powellomyces hirtus]|nr:serine-threonine protein kinase 19-domain-containing protein [Powellomyces hirtus]
MASPKGKGKRSLPVVTWSSADNAAIARLLAAHPANVLQPSLSTRLRKSFPMAAAEEKAVQRTVTKSHKSVLEVLLEIRSTLPITVPPLVLIHQLYAELGHASCDHEIAKLCKAGAVRKFRVGTLGEFCLMLCCDYADQIRDIASDYKASRIFPDTDVTRESPKKKANTLQTDKPARLESKMSELRDVRDDLFDRYLVYVSKGDTGIFVTKSELMDHMDATEDEISELFSFGFLTLKDVDTYWISVRNAGVFWSNFSRGRNELLQAIKRRRYNEMLRTDMEEKPLRSCILPGHLIIADLLGKGFVDSFNTPMGVMIRLKKSAGLADVKWS